MAGQRDTSDIIRNDSGSFAVTIAILSCIYNALVAVSCAYMPDDPLHIGLSISLYAWAGTILSALGLAGIVAKRPTLITSFAHFLLIDTLVSTVCRILVLQFFVEAFHGHNICSDGFEPTWSTSNFRHEIVTSVRWQQDNLWQFNHKRRCRVALGAVKVVLVALVICLTAAQCMLAFRMRRFAKEVERPRDAAKPQPSPQPSHEGDREKAAPLELV